MSDVFTFLVILVLPFLCWYGGYHVGKLAGIREVEHLFEEQRRDYEKFRDTLVGYCKLYREENDKLRELCLFALQELRCNENLADAATEQLIEQMREFGIEAS